MKRRMCLRKGKKGVGVGGGNSPHSDNFLFEDIDKILGKDGEEGIWIRKTLKF